MGKIKTKFVCQECGGETSKWFGRCPNCSTWNSLVEGRLEPPPNKGAWFGHGPASSPQRLAELETEERERIVTGSGELDRVLGGGIVPGSVVLVGGDPGIGKSTLLLQVAQAFAQSKGVVLYVSGEESPKQIKIRALRLGDISNRLLVYGENELELILKQTQEIRPGLVIIDSIQTVFHSSLASAPGSVSQVRECTAELARVAKMNDLPMFIVGHVTKDGSIAGPRVLEHIVDTVLYVEGERHHSYRILRGVKNRFGSTNEIGMFEMTQKGMGEVKDPSLFLLGERPLGVSGSVVVPSMEGSRPLLVEVQSLVSSANYGTARRMTTGVDYNRVTLIGAVLEKRIGLSLSNQDIYVNITGGIRLDEPALDLGIGLAIVSSYRNRPIPSDTIVLGEIGLTGEVRGVTRIEQRVKEAQKLGFTRCILPERNLRDLEELEGVQLVGITTVEHALDIVLGG